MNFNDYQKATERTSGIFANLDTELVAWSMGLAGESGEVVDYLKKVIFHGHALDSDIVKKELGDVLWYLSRMADAVGVTLQEIAEANIEKLKKRYPDGFSEERSINREE